MVPQRRNKQITVAPVPTGIGPKIFLKQPSLTSACTSLSALNDFQKREAGGQNKADVVSPPPLILPPVVLCGLAQYVGSTYDRMKAIFISARPFPCPVPTTNKNITSLRMMCHGTRSAPLLPHIKGHYVQGTSLIT